MKKNQIILGDSIKEMKKLKDHSVDLIFADPPYNLQLKDTLYRPDQTTVEAVTQDWDKFSTYKEYDQFTNAHETLLWCTTSREVKYTFNYQNLKELNEGKQMRSDWYIPICSGKERLRKDNNLSLIHI